MRKAILAVLFLFPSLTFASTYGSNFLTGGTMTCNAQDAVEVCANALDGNTSTDWYTNNAYPNWIKYDLGAGTTKTAAELYIMPLSTAGGTYFKDWELYGSNNNSNFYLLSTGTIPQGYSNTWRTFDFTPSSTAYRYYRLNALNNQHSNPGTSIVEWNLKECLDCGGGNGGTSISTTTQYTGFMSAETDQILQYLLHGGIVILVAWFVIKLFRK